MQVKQDQGQGTDAGQTVSGVERDRQDMGIGLNKQSL